MSQRQSISLVASCAFFAVAFPAGAQSCSSGLHIEGSVFDPTGAAIVGALVEAGSSTTQTNAAGHYELQCLSVATAHLTASANGFAPEWGSVTLHAGRTGHFDFHLQMARVETNVDVGDSDAISLDPDRGIGTHVLTQDEIQQLSDDPDDFQRELQILAAANGGAPGQARITVDGFQNASAMPPKASIARIVTAPDLFSAEYDRPPYADRAKQPTYDVELIDRSGRNVQHYTNTADQAAIDQSSGMTVHRVAMQFDGPADPEKGAQYLLRFNTETGVPVVWQFVLGTDISDQRSGLSPVPASIPILSYRGQGGLADQGTALKVGDATSAADVWKELAHPPFFVPYRGALSTGVQILSFVPESATWRASAQTFTNASDASLSIARDANTVVLSDDDLGTSASYTLEGPLVARVSFGPSHAKRDNTATRQFSPPLTPEGQSSFEIIAGKNKIAGGTVQTTGSNPQSRGITWTFSAPETLKGKTAVASAALRP